MILLTKHEINASITDRYASICYEFEFENTDRYASNELKFEITIDPDAFISGFSANIDGELFIGETKEKKFAKKEYVAAKEKNSSAILISQPFADIENVFSIKTNISAKSVILLKIKIEEYLKKKLHFNEVNIEIVKEFCKYNIFEKCGDILINIDINEKTSIDDIKIPNIIHKKTFSKSKTKCEIKGRINKTSNLNEFILKYKVCEESNILFDKKSKTFVHILNICNSGYIARRVVFIIDKSGSMSGSKWEKTINATNTTLKQLRTGYDRYCVMFFNSGIQQSHNGMVLADAHSINQSIKYVNDESAGGSTNINDALMKGIQLIQNDENDDLYMNQIILITDGEPNSGETDTNNIISNVMFKNRLCTNAISIFCFGVGSDGNDSSWINDLNHSFLKLLAVNTNAIYKRIKVSHCDTQLNQYFNVLSSPVAKNIVVNYQNMDIELTQNTFHTLYDGNDIIICGKINHHKTLDLNVNISFITASNGKPVQINNKIYINLSDSDSNNNIQRIWAYLKLNQLAQNRLRNDDIIQFDDDDDQIPLALAMQYKFVTPWTSMIVVKHKNEQKTQTETKSDSELEMAMEQPKAEGILPTDGLIVDLGTTYSCASAVTDVNYYGINACCDLDLSDDSDNWCCYENESESECGGLDDDVADMITLQSGGPNPVSFEVNRRYTIRSELCKSVYEGDANATTIPIKKVRSETLQIVIDYMNQQNAPLWDENEWINTFEMKTLSDIASAADYMDIPDLYSLANSAMNKKEKELNVWIDIRIKDIFAKTKTNVSVQIIDEILLVFDIDNVSLKLKDFTVDNMVYLVKKILSHIVFNEDQRQMICKYFVEEKVDGKLFVELVEKNEFVANIKDFVGKNSNIPDLQKLQNTVCLF